MQLTKFVYINKRLWRHTTVLAKSQSVYVRPQKVFAEKYLSELNYFKTKNTKNTLVKLKMMGNFSER